MNRNSTELRLLLSILCAIGLPLLLAYVLIAADLRIDLAELKPAPSAAENSLGLIGWQELETQDNLSRPALARRVRILGYMMDAYQPSRDGDLVNLFILLPDAGYFLHAAHRIPDQMIEVRLKSAEVFQFRQLVWVSGMLRSVQGRREADRAAYALTGAKVEPAQESEIRRWFRP